MSLTTDQESSLSSFVALTNADLPVATSFLKVNHTQQQQNNNKHTTNRQQVGMSR